MPLIVKLTLLELAFLLSTPVAAKTQCFEHLSYNSNFQLINGSLSELKKLLRCFNGTVNVAFFRIPLSLPGLGRLPV